ncbi:MAG: fasciclin domain-containing protein [Planctomycetes bacterium]|nr:fasciclin domain-containing protein [Planctomycetota bacterium]
MPCLSSRLALGALLALPFAAIASADECPLAAAKKAQDKAHVQKVALKADSKDIVDTAVAAGSFKTLVAAVQAAGLVETLKGKGPFTVFAPTDEAFAKLPAGTVETLLKPENKAKLVSVLTYHVVPGKVMAADVVKLTEAPTVQGSKAKVKVTDGTVTIDAAKVVKTDIETSNGVIHVIDAVILPPNSN